MSTGKMSSYKYGFLCGLLCLVILSMQSFAQDSISLTDALAAAGVETTSSADDASQSQAATVNVETLPTTATSRATDQQADQRKSEDQGIVLNIADAKGRLRDATVLPETIPTLFFTAWQHALLQEAKIGFKTRLPDPGDVAADDGTTPKVLDPGIRELSLGGIAFGNISSWTVWLNGVRVTPQAIPDQVLDIKVSRAYIDLKWFDRYTNKIYPVRLRPHERFNLDSRIFLPGSPS